MIRGSVILYGVLAVACGGICAWQLAEHSRVKRAARAGLVNRAKAISTTVGLVLKSQRRFIGVISQERLESALNELDKSFELKSVALLNASGEIVASAGVRIANLDPETIRNGAEYWEETKVTLVNLVDLGTNVVREEEQRPIIVLPRRDATNGASAFDWRERASRFRTNRNSTNLDERPAPPPGEPPPGRPPPGGRPRWMTEEEYKKALQQRGLHSFVMVLPTDTLRASISNDFWMRILICSLCVVAVGGLALAWQNVAKSSDLQIRLVRASELTNHLKEMNLAAAGLAHETRNPLNIIRGLAQMISRLGDATPEVRQKSREITDEVDRVTAQLNEFINYSKPREVRRTPVALAAVTGEVSRALLFDLVVKAIRLSLEEAGLTVIADEQLLRQLLFNLLLNAIQAVSRDGEIKIVTAKTGETEAMLEVQDNGPGLAPDQREEIFKPYFTTHQQGTGLGLAVVKQIVLAHEWEIECLPNNPNGAVFRLSHLKLAGTT